MIPQVFILAALPFLSPWMAAAGGALAGVPIIIHLLNRRRFRRVIWAAMDWLLAAQRKNARRIRIEQLLLLLIRCMIMILIGMALAQPILKAMNIGGMGQRRVLRVIVLDDSYSMNDGARKTETPADKAEAAKFAANDTPFDKTQAAAIDLIHMFDNRDQVMVILAGAPARPLFREPGTEHKAIIEGIASMPRTARGTDLGGSLRMVKEVFAKEKSLADEDVQLVLITDRSRSAWRPAAGGAAGEPTAAALESAVRDLRDTAPKMRIHVVDVGEDNPDNLAITDLSVRHEVAATEHQLFVTATIHNFSGEPKTGLKLKLTRDPHRDLAGDEKGDDKVKTVAVKTVPAGGLQTVEERMAFTEPGFHTVRAVLLGPDGKDPTKDNTLVDNERFLTLRVRRWINVRLVDGKPAPLGGKPSESEVFWLRQALAPSTETGEKREQELEAYTLHPDDDTTIRPHAGWLDHHDLLVLANVELAATAQNKELAAEIAQFVRRGGGLIVFMGSLTRDKENIKAYNDLLYNDGTGPMPAKLGECVGSDDRINGENLEVRPEDLNHPVLATFKSKDDPLKSAQFYRHVKAELPANSQATVLLKYSGGDPAIVINKFGDGKVALVTSSADTSWNNFGNKPDYLPLFQELAYHLSPVADLSRNLPMGSPISELMTAEQAKESGLTLMFPGWTVTGELGPFKATTDLRAPDAAGQKSADRWQYQTTTENLDQPGLYLLKVGEVRSQLGPDNKPLPTDRLEQLSRFWYAVNPPALAEGDLRTVTPDAIKDILGKDVVVLKPADLKKSKADLMGGSDVSRTLLYVVLALCLLETLLAQRFGHFRE